MSNTPEGWVGQQVFVDVLTGLPGMEITKFGGFGQLGVHTTSPYLLVSVEDKGIVISRDGGETVKFYPWSSVVSISLA